MVEMWMFYVNTQNALCDFKENYLFLKKFSILWMYEIYPSLQHYLLLGSETRNKCPNKNKWIYVLGQFRQMFCQQKLGFENK